MSPIDALEVLAAGLAGRAHMDVLRPTEPAPLALVTAKQPVARMDRGNKRKRRAVTPLKPEFGRECTVKQERIISRGANGEFLTAGDSRPEKLVSVDWSIILVWK